MCHCKGLVIAIAMVMGKGTVMERFCGDVLEAWIIRADGGVSFR